MKKLSQSNRRLEMAQGQVPHASHNKHLSNAAVMSPSHGGTAGVQRHGSLHGGAPSYV